MRFPLIPILVILFVNACIDLYIYCALQSYFRRRVWAKIQGWSSIFFFIGLVVVICLPKMGGGDRVLEPVMWMLYAYLSVYIPKIIFFVFDVLSRLPFLWRSHRWRWMSWTGFGIAILAFLGMWWGALINRHRIQVREVTVEIAGLPRAFDGYRIAQISDLHTGSYGHNPNFIHKLVQRINALSPDITVFTGDLVNRRSNELLPFTQTLSAIKSPVYSVMGNHDYGDYSNWPTPADKQRNVEQLVQMQTGMGWHVLNNDVAWLHQGRDSIALIGVENVGDPPFKTYGDLRKAYPHIEDAHVKILLTHNPAHWVDDIADNIAANIALTLSGHTHAMQIEIFGLSPAAWRYKTWGGLYSDKYGRYLYVNIGAGEVAFPARIGATPEITIITLKPKR